MLELFVCLLMVASEIRMTQLLKTKAPHISCQDIFVANTADMAGQTAVYNNLMIKAQAVPHGLPCPRQRSTSSSSPKKGVAPSRPMPKSLIRQKLVISAASQIHLKIVRGTSLVLSYSKFYGSRSNESLGEVCNFSGDALLSSRRRQTAVVCNPYWKYSTNCSCFVARSLKYFSPKQPCVNLVVSNQLRPTNTSVEARNQATLVLQAFTAVGRAKCSTKNTTEYIHYYETYSTIEPGGTIVLKVNEGVQAKFFYKDSVDRNGLPYADVCGAVVPKSFAGLKPANRHFLIAKSHSTGNVNGSPAAVKYPSPCPMTFDRRNVDFDPVSRKCLLLLIGSAGPTNKYAMHVILSKSYVCFDNLEFAGLDQMSEVASTPLKTGNHIFVKAVLAQPVVVVFKSVDGVKSSVTCYESLDLAPFSNIGRKSFVEIKCSYEKVDRYRCKCHMEVMQ